MNSKGQAALEGLAAPWLENLALWWGYVAITVTSVYFLIKLNIFFIQAIGWCIAKTNEIFKSAEDMIPPKPPKGGMV